MESPAWCPNKIAQQLEWGIILPYREKRESTHHSFLGQYNQTLEWRMGAKNRETRALFQLGFTINIPKPLVYLLFVESYQSHLVFAKYWLNLIWVTQSAKSQSNQIFVESESD